MIPIRNIYYMLAYAFSALKEKTYRSMATEEFENAAELCAAILERGIASLVKRGLGQEFVGKTEALSGLRGKIEITESIKTRAILRQQLVCTYDEFSADTELNRIIKVTVELLLKSDISKDRKKGLRKLIVFFDEVESVDLHLVDWNIRYNRNNQTYRMLIAVCWLVAKGLLQTQADGSRKMMDFFDEQKMHALYEKFVLEYYRQEWPELSATPSYMEWVVDDGFRDLLPMMKSDITLVSGDRTLIIDTKYYIRSTSVQYGKRSIHSNNLYQIFAYVKNKEEELARAGVPHEVSGMLLYAGTDEEIQPDNDYMMSGNRISARTLDLNREFSEIRAQLDGIAEEYFGKAVQAAS